MNGHEMSLLMYADDIVFVSKSYTGLQKMLDCLHKWCMQWKLKVNIDKTKVIHFRQGPKSSKTNFVFKYGSEVLEIVSSYTYLGLLFNEFLDDSLSCKAIARSASRALGLLIAKSKAHGGMPYETFTKLYNSLVQPVMDYSAGIWGTKMFSCINSVQRRAERFFLGVGKYTPNAALQGELGWNTPEHHYWLCVFHLWLRLKTMDKTRINYRVFAWSSGP